MLTQVKVRERPASASPPTEGPAPSGASAASEPEQLTLPLGELAACRPSPSPGGRAYQVSRAAAEVAAFHRAFHLPLERLPCAQGIPADLLRLRERLLDEELAEYMTASHRGDLVGMADALADIVYVAYGSALSFGVDLDALLAEVHRSNMSKLDCDGRPIMRADGKVLKSPGYVRPDIQGTLNRQLPLPF